MSLVNDQLNPSIAIGYNVLFVRSNRSGRDGLQTLFAMMAGTTNRARYC